MNIKFFSGPSFSVLLRHAVKHLVGSLQKVKGYIGQNRLVDVGASGGRLEGIERGKQGETEAAR